MNEYWINQPWNLQSQNSRPEMFCKKGVLRNFKNSLESTCARVSISIKLQAWACKFIKKETLAQVFSCEFYEIVKNNFFYRTPSVAASESWYHSLFFLIFLLGSYYLGKLGTSNRIQLFWWNMTRLVKAMPSSCYFLPGKIEPSKSLMIFLLLWQVVSNLTISFFQCHTLREKVRIRSYSGPYFSRIFLHSEWIWRDTDHLSAFSPNVRKSGKNASQNNSEYRLFLRSDSLKFYDHSCTFTICIILWSHNFHLAISKTTSSSKSTVDRQIVDYFCEKVDRSGLTAS